MLEKRNTEAVRVMLEEEIFRIASSLPYQTSVRLNWSGVEVHRYHLQAFESPEHSYPQLTAFIFHSDKLVKGELRLAGAKVTAELREGTVSIAPAGLPFSSKNSGSGEVTAIFLDPLTIAEIARAETGDYNLEILPQYAIRDPLIQEIGTALDSELMSPCPAPRVYAESLAATLAAHILAKYANPLSSRPRGIGITKTQLRRSIEFIHDHLDRDLALADIAAVANMSKYHFAKSFRQAMGIAPHHYLIKLRIEKARKLLLIDTMSVEEIASRVGYADKSHFAAQFRRIVGTTPHRYRREL